MTQTPAPARFVTPAFPPAHARAALTAIEALGAEIGQLEHTLGLAKNGDITLADPGWRVRALHALEHLRRERTQFKQWLREEAATRPARPAVTDERALILALYDVAGRQVSELRRMGLEPDAAAQTVLDNAHAYLSARA